jgi:hypothetical protein
MYKTFEVTSYHEYVGRAVSQMRACGERNMAGTIAYILEADSSYSVLF